jgi:arylsulfatase A
MRTIKRRDFLNLCGTAAAAYSFTSLGCSSREGASRPPNIVLFFADDMGYGDLGCYGHPTIRTPRLDRMAAEGVRLTSFYAAAPYCTPSRVGLLTGRYPVRTGQYNNLGPESVGGLSLDERLVPEVLKARGYRTKAIGKWHLGHNPAEYLPTSRGFDSYLGLLYSNDMIRPWVQTDEPMHLYRDRTIIEEHPVDQDRLTERYTEEAVQFIKESGDSPFFLYFPHSMPHLPVRTSDRFRGESEGGLYGDVIETIDWSVGRVLDTLKETGKDGNTMVIFTSDNGPWLNLPPRMLQGGNERWHSGTKSLLRGSKGTTFEGGQRVPAIFRWPGHIPAGGQSAEMASTLDIYATIIKAAGGTVPGDRIMDGTDILPFLKGRAPSPRDEFFYFLSNRLEAVRSGDWKLRVTGRREEETGETAVTTELFHLGRDPGESYNVADRYPGRVSDLYARMREFAAELNAGIVPLTQ